MILFCFEEIYINFNEPIDELKALIYRCIDKKGASRNLDEKELIIKIQSGDMNAFAIIFEKYKNEAVRYSYLIIGNKHTSEDIVQDAFVTCYTKIKSLKKQEQFKSWFFKILTRIAWKYYKKEKKSVPVDNIFEKADYETNCEAISKYIKKEQADILHEVIDELDIKQKMVIILYYFNELTIKEIAQIMECFEGTVKSRLYTARKKLKKSLMDFDKCEDIREKEYGVL